MFSAAGFIFDRWETTNGAAMPCSTGSLIYYGRRSIDRGASRPVSIIATATKSIRRFAVDSVGIIVISCLVERHGPCRPSRNFPNPQRLAEQGDFAFRSTAASGRPGSRDWRRLAAPVSFSLTRSRNRKSFFGRP